jgi:cysteine dioxygenase
MGKTLKDQKEVLLNYIGDDWKNYQNFDKSKYVRNKVYSDNDIEIIIICWHSHQMSGVHNHPENGCIVRVLSGELKEEQYELDNGKLKIIKTNCLKMDDTSYQEGINGIHNIVNESDERAITLHIYSPPNYEPYFFKKS